MPEEWRTAGRVTARFEDTLARSLASDELVRALGSAVDALIREAAELGSPLESELRALARS
jgi:hypothetical protein